MTHDIACLLHNPKCKDALRAIDIQDIRITLLHKIPELLSLTKINSYDLLIVDSMHNDSEFILKHVNTYELCNSTIIVTPQFNREVFRKYIKRGFRYVVDADTFVYIIPTILENLTEFLQNDLHTTKETTKKGLTISIECGYIIFHGCKVTISRSALRILSTLLNSEGYCNLEYLQNCLEKSLAKEVSSSYITVTISRLNKEVYRATGMKIIKNRYGFGYYLDI